MYDRASAIEYTQRIGLGLVNPSLSLAFRGIGEHRSRYRAGGGRRFAAL